MVLAALSFLWRTISFNWVGPLIDAAQKDGTLSEDNARAMVPASDEAQPLAEQFEKKLKQVKQRWKSRR